MRNGLEMGMGMGGKWIGMGDGMGWDGMEGCYFYGGEGVLFYFIFWRGEEILKAGLDMHTYRAEMHIE